MSNRLAVRTVGVALPGHAGAAGGVTIEVEERIDVAALLARLAPPDAAHLALFVNGAQLHEAAFAGTRLADGDELVLVRPIEGG